MNFGYVLRKKTWIQSLMAFLGIQATSSQPQIVLFFLLTFKRFLDSINQWPKKSIGVNSSVMHMSLLLLMFHFRGNMRVHRSSMVFLYFSLCMCVCVAVIIIFYYLINLSRLQCTKVYVTNEHFVVHFFLFIFGP